MVFIILGSQKFQFDRLLKKVDELIEEGVITDSVFAQTGSSTYSPKNYESVPFLDKTNFEQVLGKSTVVISHGGTGAIIGAVKNKKKVLAVPRLACYGEHVDDHQLQILKQFDEMNIIEPCYDMKELGGKYKKLQNSEYVPYYSNTSNIVDSISEFLKKEFIF